MKSVISQIEIAIGHQRGSIPVIIPTFNNPTYLSGMLAQLECRNISSPIVLDNCSTYPPMLSLLENIDRRVNVVRLPENFGPHYIFNNPEVFSSLPDVFCYTDPDLELNPDMPTDFMETLKDLTEEYQVGKAGVALDLSDHKLFRKGKFFAGGQHRSIRNWEKKYWRTKLSNSNGLEIYQAPIDTTLAIYNKRFFDPMNFYDAVRVAGLFTAKHKPWYQKTEVPTSELEYYSSLAKYSVYNKNSK